MGSRREGRMMGGGREEGGKDIKEGNSVIEKGMVVAFWGEEL